MAGIINGYTCNTFGSRVYAIIFFIELGFLMNKEIDLKKFLVVLLVYLLVVSILLIFVFGKIKPFYNDDNPCNKASCSLCHKQDGKKYCNECSIFNEKEERIWVGSCIFEE